MTAAALKWQIAAVIIALAVSLALLFWFARERRRRRRAELEARQSLMEIARLDHVATAGVLAASIAHEIKQPLAGIGLSAKAALNWLDRPAPDTAEAIIALERIAECVHAADEVIAATRAMLRMEEVQRRLVDVAALTHDVVEFARPKIEAHQILVEYTLRNQGIHILANHAQMQQVLLNLILNAVEAMQTINGRPRVMQLAAGIDGDGRVNISVADVGDGIDPSVAGHIFEPLFTRKSDGTGLGLAISRWVVEAHGGTLEMASRQPYGSTFTIILPSADAHAGAHARVKQVAKDEETRHGPASRNRIFWRFRRPRADFSPPAVVGRE